MVDFLKTEHFWTVLTPEDLVDVLEDATIARDLPGMADYLPLFPWFGMFLIGAAIGRLFYRDRQSLLPQGWTKPLTLWGRPLLFLGRHPLTVYVVHQPLLLLLIWLILKGLRLA